MESSSDFEYVQSNTNKLENYRKLNLSKDGFEVLADKFFYCRRKKIKVETIDYVNTKTLFLRS